MSQVVWPLGLIFFALTVREATKGSSYPDFQLVWQASRAFLHHKAIFNGDAYLYPPFAAPLFAPLAALPNGAAKDLVLGAEIAGLIATLVITARMVSDRIVLVVGVGVLGLAFFGPVYSGLLLGNISVLLVPVFAVYLYLAWREHWVWASGILGLSLAFKPVLLPLLLIPLVDRQWRALAVAAGTAVGLSLLALPLVADGTQFFTHTAPLLVRGGPATVSKNNLSISGIAHTLGAPSVLALMARLGVAAVTLVAAYESWRKPRDNALRLIETSSVLLIGWMLVSSLDEVHYQLLLVPLLLSVFHPQSVLRVWPAWVAVFMFGSTQAIPNLGFTSIQMSALRQTAGLGLLLLVMAVEYSRPLAARWFLTRSTAT